MASCHKFELVISHASSTQLSVLIEVFRRQLAFCLFAWDLGMTLESIRERSQSRLKLIREQFWYKLLCYELVNPTIKISLYYHLPFKRIQNYTHLHPLFKSWKYARHRGGRISALCIGTTHRTKYQPIYTCVECVCVCIYVLMCIYVCIYMYIHTHTHARTRTRKHTHTHTHVYTHTDRGREVFLHGVLVLQAARNTPQTTAPLPT